MKAKDLKNKLNKLSKAQLNQEVFYYSKDNGLSGSISNMVIQRGNLFWDGSDDPATLYTKKELKENYENDEIDTFTVEIPKGSIVIEF